MLLDENRRIAVIIENKIGSSEHSDQLRRYQEAIRRQYPDWKLIPIFLTPEGAEPSDEAYISLDYGAVSEIVLNLAESRRSNLEPEVYGLLLHYSRLLRRYVVEDSEIADLCRQIYAKHQRAIDLVLEHRPGEQEQRGEVLVDLISMTGGLVLDRRSRASLLFIPEEWDQEELKCAENWTPSRRILLFDFEHVKKGMGLVLQIGPGDRLIRDQLIDAARAAGPPFRVPAQPTHVWTRLYSDRVLTRRELEELSLDEQQDRIRRFWDQFTGAILPAMIAGLRLPSQASLDPDQTPVERFGAVAPT